MSMVLRARRARLLCCASVMLLGAATPAFASGPALPADPLPADMASRDAAGPDPQTDIVVQANRQATAQKEQSPAVVDSQPPAGSSVSPCNSGIGALRPSRQRSKGGVITVVISTTPSSRVKTSSAMGGKPSRAS